MLGDDDAAGADYQDAKDIQMTQVVEENAGDDNAGLLGSTDNVPESSPDSVGLQT